MSGDETPSVKSKSADEREAQRAATLAASESVAGHPSSGNTGGSQGNGKKLFPLFSGEAREASTHKGQNGVHAASTSSGSATANGSKKVAKGKASAKSNGTASEANFDAPLIASGGKGSGKATHKASKVGKEGKTGQRQKKNSSSPGLVDTTASTVASTSASTPPPSISREVITITDSPVRELRPTKTFADFRAERQIKKAVKEASGWDGGRLPLWPSRDTLHVCAAEHIPHEAPARHRNWKGKGRATESDESALPGRSSIQVPSPLNDILERWTAFDPSAKVLDLSHEFFDSLDEASLSQIRNAHRNGKETANQQMWSAKYAPTKASEVLGLTNKENATYLRDWLLELSLQDPLKKAHNSRKRRVKREVTSDERKRIRRAAKRRKRKDYAGNDDDLNDFVASDTEELEHYDYYDLPDDSSNPSPTKSASSSQAEPSGGRFSPLTNVILLAGPVAAGKTSIAYAVANELSWEVFEVFPGIGKRAYKDLEKYIGMVGDNHIMKRESQAAAAATFFGKAASKTGESKATADLASPSSESAPNGSSASGPTAKSDNHIKQSFVLIEEIDVLFNSDSGFWEGLTAFVARSRRPIVLTCNDLGAVPMDMLPIQCVLNIFPTPRPTAAAFLYAIAQVESGQNDAKSAYNEIEESSALGYVDLRQALTRLRTRCWNVADANKQTLDRASLVRYPLQAMVWTLENASFADAELKRLPAYTVEDAERVAQPDKEDDEFLQHPALPVGKLSLTRDLLPSQPLPDYGREAEFCAIFGISSQGDDPELTESQYTYCDTLHDVADELLDDTGVRTDDPILHLDLLPLMREIVAADDDNERAWHAALEIKDDDIVLDARKRRSRRLAGAGKEGYHRHCDMSGGVVQALKQSRLRDIDTEEPDSP